MIEYQLKDADGNTYDLNGSAVTVELKKTWRQGGDSFGYDNKIVERSFLPGSVLIGEPRIMSRLFTLSVDKTAADSSDWRDELNELLSFITKTRAIVDVTNDMEISVVPSSISVDSDRGSEKLFSENTFEFVALTPYWQGLTAVSYSGTIPADTLTGVAVTNGGFFTTGPVITFDTTAAVNSVQLYVESSQEGIQVDDVIFGTAGNLEMVIDNVAGLVSIGELNRNASVAEGTGFFLIPEGAQTIQVLVADEDVDYVISFFERFYI